MEFSLSALSLKRLLYLTLITSTCFIIYSFQFNHSESHWIVWSTLFLAMTIGEGSVFHHVKVIALTGFALMLVVGLIGLLSGISFVLATVLAILSFVCIYYSQKQYQYFASALLINLMGILAGFQAPTLFQNIERVSYIAISLLIVILFQFIFYFGFIKNEFQFRLQVSLRHLQLLSKEIFSCLIYPEYNDHIYLFERRIHIQKNMFMRSFNQLQKIQIYAAKSKPDENAKLNQILVKLNVLYDILIDCSILRFRIKDHAIFKVCALELMDLSRAIDNAFSELLKLFKTSKQKSLDIMQLVQKIQKLEENYQNVLQVAATNPLAFFLFINSIKSLIAEMEVFYITATEIKL